MFCANAEHFVCRFTTWLGSQLRLLGKCLPEQPSIRTPLTAELPHAACAAAGRTDCERLHLYPRFESLSCTRERAELVRPIGKSSSYSSL